MDIDTETKKPEENFVMVGVTRAFSPRDIR
jgi:hypothetical protein